MVCILFYTYGHIDKTQKFMRDVDLFRGQRSLEFLTGTNVRRRPTLTISSLNPG